MGHDFQKSEEIEVITQVEKEIEIRSSFKEKTKVRMKIVVKGVEKAEIKKIIFSFLNY